MKPRAVRPVARRIGESLALRRFIPAQNALFDDVEEAGQQQQRHEHNHLDEAGAAEGAEIHGPGIHEDNLDIKQHEHDGCEEVLYRNRGAGVAHALDAALERRVLHRAVALGAHEVGNNHGEGHKSQGQTELDDNRKIIGGLIIGSWQG